MGLHHLRRMKNIFMATTVLASGFAVVSVASESSAATSSGGCKAPPSIVLGGFAPGTTITTDVAQGMGAFKQVEKACHTKISFSYVSAPNPMVVGLTSNAFQYIMVAPTAQLSAIQTGEMVTDLATFVQGGTGNIVTAKATAPKQPPGIQAFKEYPSNSLWGVTSLNSTSTLDIDLLLDATGGDSSQAQFIGLGTAGIISAVATSKVDLGDTPPATTGPLIVGGQVSEVLNTSGIQAYKLIGFIPGFSLQSTPQFIEKYPKLSQMMVEAELKGMFFIQKNFTNPQAIYNLEPSSFTSATPEAAFAASWGWISASYTTTGLITLNDLKHLGTQMAKYKVLPNGFDPKSFPSSAVNSKILKAAYGALGKPFPTSKVNTKLLTTAPE